jgi:hypothetical protein
VSLIFPCANEVPTKLILDRMGKNGRGENVAVK